MRHYFGFTLAIIAFMALGSASWADELSNWQSNTLEAQKKEWNQVVGGAPDMDAKNPSRRMDQLVLLSLENGNLVLGTPSASTPPPAPGKDGYCKIMIEGWNDWASIRIKGGAGSDHKPVIPGELEVAPASFLSDQIRRVAANKLSGQIALTSTVQTVDGIENTEILEQNTDDDFTHPHPCTLIIFKFKPSRRNGQRPVVITFVEPDFATLVRKHGDVFRQYYRPLFHQLNADFVFAVEPPIAWQVLPDAWQSDPKTAAAVKALLPQLATGTFHQRGEARKSLEAMGTPGALEILHLDRTGLTPEQNAQLDRVVAAYRQLTDDQVKTLRTDPQFLMDCLYCSDPLIRQSAIEQLRKTTRLDLAFDPAADESARNTAIAAVREKLVAGKFLAEFR